MAISPIGTVSCGVRGPANRKGDRRRPDLQQGGRNYSLLNYNKLDFRELINSGMLPVRNDVSWTSVVGFPKGIAESGCRG